MSEFMEDIEVLGKKVFVKFMILGKDLDVNEKEIEMFVKGLKFVLRNLLKNEKKISLEEVEVLICNYKAIADAEFDEFGKKVIINFDYGFFKKNVFDEREMNKILFHEFGHYLDRDKIGFMSRVKKFFLNKVDEGKVVNKDVVIKLNQIFRINAENKQELIMRVFEKIRVEGFADFLEKKSRSGSLIGSSREVRIILNDFFNEKFFMRIKGEFLYDVGGVIFALIAYMYYFKDIEIKQKRGLVRDEVFMDVRYFNVVKRDHNEFKLKNSLDLDETMRLVGVLKSFSLVDMIREYECACDFFDIEKEFRIVDRKMFRSIRNKYF